MPTDPKQDALIRADIRLAELDLATAENAAVNLLAKEARQAVREAMDYSRQDKLVSLKAATHRAGKMVSQLKRENARLLADNARLTDSVMSNVSRLKTYQQALQNLRNYCNATLDFTAQ